MQVITLNPTEFDTHAAMLANTVEGGSTERFDAIVAVRRGGSFVCDAFLRHFPRNRYGARFDISLQRPSTKRKGGVIAKVLKCLPRPLLNAMRMAESAVLEWKRRHSEPKPAPYVEVSDGLISIMSQKKNPEILVIDDAIDSGDTLAAIVKALKGINTDARIRTSVMTETTRSPRIRADYTLYRNRTLIRFPWSNDYRTPKQQSHAE